MIEQIPTQNEIKGKKNESPAARLVPEFKNPKKYRKSKSCATLSTVKAHTKGGAG
jgi:hypothetical protein